jgi:hypothetical protein
MAQGNFWNRASAGVAKRFHPQIARIFAEENARPASICENLRNLRITSLHLLWTRLGIAARGIGRKSYRSQTMMATNGRAPESNFP